MPFRRKQPCPCMLERPYTLMIGKRRIGSTWMQNLAVHCSFDRLQIGFIECRWVSLGDTFPLALVQAGLKLLF